MYVKSLCISAAMFAGSALPLSALTLSFDDTTSFSTNNPFTGASGIVDLAFSNVVNDTDDGRDHVQIDITVTNNTDVTTFGAGATSSKLTGFAFDALNGLDLLLFAEGSFLDTFLTGNDASLPPFGTFSWAFADNGNFQGGGPGQALPEGQSDMMSLLVASAIGNAAAVESAYVSAFATLDDEIDAVLRFQDVNAGAGSEKLLWTGGEEIPPVPLPAAGWMLLASLGGLGAMRRLKK